MAAVALGGLALAEVAHYITVGPNVEEDLEEHHHSENAEGGKHE